MSTPLPRVVRKRDGTLLYPLGSVHDRIDTAEEENSGFANAFQRANPSLVLLLPLHASHLASRFDEARSSAHVGLAETARRPWRLARLVARSGSAPSSLLRPIWSTSHGRSGLDNIGLAPV